MAGLVGSAEMGRGGEEGAATDELGVRPLNLRREVQENRRAAMNKVVRSREMLRMGEEEAEGGCQKSVSRWACMRSSKRGRWVGSGGAGGRARSRRVCATEEGRKALGATGARGAGGGDVCDMISLGCGREGRG